VNRQNSIQPQNANSLAHLPYGKWLILFLCGIGFAEPSELKACDNHLLFLLPKIKQIKTMILSIKQQKFLFFWVIFNTIGYVSYLIDLHPKYTNTLRGEGIVISEKYYLLTPDEIYCPLCDTNYSPAANFYPFHSFTFKIYYRSYVYDGFIGLWGYYDHKEYIVYVIIPLLILLLIYIYRRLFPQNGLPKKSITNK